MAILLLGDGVKINAEENIDKDTISVVALSGEYNDLKNKPELFSGSYNDLTNKPKYGDLEGTPTLATVAETGKYEDIVIEENTKEKLLYIDKDGKPTYLSLKDLKAMLEEVVIDEEG